jgi:CIC family chloride channel protein
LVLQWGLRLVGTQGSTNLLEVVVAGDGRLPLRSVLIKVLSSALSISTGASVGREGSIVHLGATLASKVGQWAHWPPYRLRLLLACGAAAGLAAAYNAPVAGAVFAAQIVLGNFSMNLFAPLLCASVVAAVVSRSFFGIEPWYRVPDFDVTRVTQLPWFLALGVGAGVLGACFLKSLHRAEALFRQTGLPMYARITAAGIVVGAIAMWYPQVWGNGYSVTSRVLDDQYQALYSGRPLLLVFLGGLLLAKLSATVLSVGAGTVGGVFTPTLFLGAALGSIFGHGLHGLGLAAGLPTGAFALVGMGSLVAATTHSPLLAMIIMFEISLNYSLMPPLMLACAVATLVGRRLHPASVYTEPLRQKGLALGWETDQIGAATHQTVGDLMRAPVPPLRETATLREIGNRFLVSPNNFLPVVDARGRLLGVVALQDLKGYLNAGPELQAIIAADVMRPCPPCLTPRQRLQEALPVLLASELRNIPVINDPHEGRLVGSVPRSEALARLSEAIALRTGGSE